MARRKVDPLIVARERGEQARQVFTSIFEGLEEAVSTARSVRAEEQAIIANAQGRIVAASDVIADNEALHQNLSDLLSK